MPIRRAIRAGARLGRSAKYKATAAAWKARSLGRAAKRKASAFAARNRAEIAFIGTSAALYATYLGINSVASSFKRRASGRYNRKQFKNFEEALKTGIESGNLTVKRKMSATERRKFKKQQEEKRRRAAYRAIKRDAR